MDALATGNYPAMGFSIRYEYGIFRQKLIEGWQTELPDFWLPGGEVWLVERREEAKEIHIGGIPFFIREIKGKHQVSAGRGPAFQIGTDIPGIQIRDRLKSVEIC